MTPNKTRIANRGRIANGRSLKQHYCAITKLEPIDAKQECTITDAIADLLHYAHGRGFDTDSIMRCAQNHFDFENQQEPR